MGKSAPKRCGNCVHFSREMGLTHAEFFRSLPSAIAHREYTVEGRKVEVDFGERRVAIELGEQKNRAIASLNLPYVEVTFSFFDFSDAQRDEFMGRFDLYFRRGGG